MIPYLGTQQTSCFSHVHLPACLSLKQHHMHSLSNQCWFICNKVKQAHSRVKAPSVTLQDLHLYVFCTAAQCCHANINHTYFGVDTQTSVLSNTRNTRLGLTASSAVKALHAEPLSLSACILRGQHSGHPDSDLAHHACAGLHLCGAVALCPSCRQCPLQPHQ